MTNVIIEGSTMSRQISPDEGTELQTSKVILKKGIMDNFDDIFVTLHCYLYLFSFTNGFLPVTVNYVMQHTLGDNICVFVCYLG